MNKKSKTRVISALLLIALVCLGTGARAEGEENTAEIIYISSPQELREIANNPSGSYALECDIDMTGEEWTPVAFSGTLDGGGYAIINLRVETLGAEQETTVDGNRKKYDTLFSGLFSTMKNAKISNLQLLGAVIDVECDSHCFAGALCGYMDECTVTDCVITCSVTLRQGGINSGVAGVAGYGWGDIKNCKVDAELIFIDENPTRNCEEFAGGAVANGYPNISDCDVTANIYASVNGYVHNGCLVGMHFRVNGGSVSTRIENNHSGGSITFFENTPSRRAYASYLIGEELNSKLTLYNNVDSGCVINESKDYTKELLPCGCGKELEKTVVSPQCTGCGYTQYKCPECGYSYCAEYTARAHTPGEWELENDATYTESGSEIIRCVCCGEILDRREINPHVDGEWEIVTPATYTEAGLKRCCCTDCGKVLKEEVIPPHTAGDWVIEKEPDYGVTGTRSKYCTDCGELLEREEIPALVRSQSIETSVESIRLQYKTSTTVSANVLPVESADRYVEWSVRGSQVVSIVPANDGVSVMVTAVGKGNTQIICDASDGGAQREVEVEVYYTWWQWIIMVLLFGWIWY